MNFACCLLLLVPFLHNSLATNIHITVQTATGNVELDVLPTDDTYNSIQAMVLTATEKNTRRELNHDDFEADECVDSSNREMGSNPPCEDGFQCVNNHCRESCASSDDCMEEGETCDPTAYVCLGGGVAGGGAPSSPPPTDNGPGASSGAGPGAGLGDDHDSDTGADHDPDPGADHDPNPGAGPGAKPYDSFDDDDMDDDDMDDDDSDAQPMPMPIPGGSATGPATGGMSMSTTTCMYQDDCSPHEYCEVIEGVCVDPTLENPEYVYEETVPCYDDDDCSHYSEPHHCFDHTCMFGASVLCSKTSPCQLPFHTCESGVCVYSAAGMMESDSTGGGGAGSDPADAMEAFVPECKIVVDSDRIYELKETNDMDKWPSEHGITIRGLAPLRMRFECNKKRIPSGTVTMGFMNQKIGGSWPTRPTQKEHDVDLTEQA